MIGKPAKWRTHRLSPKPCVHVCGYVHRRVGVTYVEKIDVCQQAGIRAGWLNASGLRADRIVVWIVVLARYLQYIRGRDHR